MRQDHHQPRGAAHAAGHGGSHPFRRRGHHHGRPHQRALSAPHADGVPGPVRLARSAHEGARHRRRAAGRARHPQNARGIPRPRGAAAVHGGPAARHGRAVSARVLRRAAPAHRHRPRAGARAEPGDLRRAGVGARRVDPGAGDQRADGAAAAAASVVPVRRARPRGGAPHQPPRGRDVPGPHRRDRRSRHAVSRTAASVHAGAAVGGAGGRPGGRKPSARARSCAAKCPA